MPLMILSRDEGDSSLLVDSKRNLTQAQYALFPFASHRSAPWTTMGSGRNVFRCKKVHEWLGSRLDEETRVGFSNRNASLVAGKGCVVTTFLAVKGLYLTVRERVSIAQLLELANNSLGKNAAVNLRYIKCGGFERLFSSTFSSTGHVLFSDGQTIPQSDSQQASLIPTLPGTRNLHEFLHWSTSSPVKASFAPWSVSSCQECSRSLTPASLPASLHDVVPACQSILHRLVYRSFNHSPEPEDVSWKSISSALLTFEARLNPPKDNVSERDDRMHSGMSQMYFTLSPLRL